MLQVEGQIDAGFECAAVYTLGQKHSQMDVEEECVPPQDFSESTRALHREAQDGSCPLPVRRSCAEADAVRKVSEKVDGNFIVVFSGEVSVVRASDAVKTGSSPQAETMLCTEMM